MDFGSNTSLNPSPKILIPKTVITIAIPGNIVSHGAVKIPSFASYKIFPKLGDGAGIPAPKKLKDASKIIAIAKTYVA